MERQPVTAAFSEHRVSLHTPTSSGALLIAVRRSRTVCGVAECDAVSLLFHDEAIHDHHDYHSNDDDRGEHHAAHTIRSG